MTFHEVLFLMGGFASEHPKQKQTADNGRDALSPDAPADGENHQTQVKRVADEAIDAVGHEGV